VLGSVGAKDYLFKPARVIETARRWLHLTGDARLPISVLNFCFDSIVQFYSSLVKFILFIMFHCLYCILYCTAVL